jgi:hypothetical protein
MKFLVLTVLLSFSSVVLADAVTLSNNGKTLTLTGLGLNSTSGEFLDFIGKAYEEGYKDPQGADYFTESKSTAGMNKFITYKNKLVTTHMSSAFALVYTTTIKAKKNEITVDDAAKFISIKGNTAKLLLGALRTANDANGRGPLGISRASTKSGKVVCSKVVHPNAVPSCTIKY